MKGVIVGFLMGLLCVIVGMGLGIQMVKSEKATPSPERCVEFPVRKNLEVQAYEKAGIFSGSSGSRA